MRVSVLGIAIAACGPKADDSEREMGNSSPEPECNYRDERDFNVDVGELLGVDLDDCWEVCERATERTVFDCELLEGESESESGGSTGGAAFVHVHCEFAGTCI